MKYYSLCSGVTVQAFRLWPTWHHHLQQGYKVFSRMVTWEKWTQLLMDPSLRLHRQKKYVQTHICRSWWSCKLKLKSTHHFLICVFSHDIPWPDSGCDLSLHTNALAPVPSFAAFCATARKASSENRSLGVIKIPFLVFRTILSERSE